MIVLDRRKVVLAAGFLITAVAGCSPGPGPSVIRIGAVYPQTGSQAAGAEQLNGVRIAAELANATAGAGNPRVEVDARDAKGGPSAAAAVEQLHNSGVRIIVGAFASSQSISASARASQLGMTYIETGALADVVTTRGLSGVLRTGPSGGMLGRQAARFARESVLTTLGIPAASSRVVVVFEDDAYGKSVAEGAIDEASLLGLNVVDSIEYNLFVADYGRIRQTLLDAEPDVVITGQYVDDAVRLGKAMGPAASRVKAIIGVSSSYSGHELADALGPQAFGLFAVDNPDAGINASGLLPAARDLLSRASSAYASRYGKPMSTTALAGFVGGWILFHEILPRAETTDQAEVLRAAMSLDLPMGSEISGSGVKFGAPGTANHGQNVRAAGVVWEWLGDGQRYVVSPPGLRQAAPRILALGG